MIQVFVGLIVWSLAEYLIHRFVLHRHGSIFWPEHRLHHKEPLAEVGVPFKVTGVASVLLLLAAWPLGFLGFAVGFVVGYFHYVAVHEFIHRRGVPVVLKRLHDIHHKGYRANYGVTTPLWDLIFFTYRGRP